MHFVLDTAITLISLVFLSILGFITAAAIPGLFSPIVAPFLDRLLPERKKPGR